MKINKEFKKNIRTLFFILFLGCALLSCSLNNVLLDYINEYITDPIASFFSDYVIFKTSSLVYIYQGIKNSIIPFISLILFILSLIYLAVFQFLKEHKTKALIASVVFIFITMFACICLFIYEYPIYYFLMFIIQIIRESTDIITFDNTVYISFLMSFSLLEVIIYITLFITFILVIISNDIKKAFKTISIMLVSLLFVLLVIKSTFSVSFFILLIVHFYSNTVFPWQLNFIRIMLSPIINALVMLTFHACAIYMVVKFIKSKNKMMITYILPYVFCVFACIVSFIFIIVFNSLYIFITKYIVDFIYQSLIF